MQQRGEKQTAVSKIQFSVFAFSGVFVQNAQKTQFWSFPPFACGKLVKNVDNFRRTLIVSVENRDVKESY